MSHIQEVGYPGHGLATCHAWILKGWDVLACRQTSQMLEVVGGKGSLAVPIPARACLAARMLLNGDGGAAAGLAVKRACPGVCVLISGLRVLSWAVPIPARVCLASKMLLNEGGGAAAGLAVKCACPGACVLISGLRVLSWAVPTPARACLEPRMLSNEDRGAAAG